MSKVKPRKKKAPHVPLHKVSSTPSPDTSNIPNPIHDNSHLRIAPRKKVHSCTHHPIANHVSYDASTLSLSPSFPTFSTSLSYVFVPYVRCSSQRKWREAMEEEMKALDKKMYLGCTKFAKRQGTSRVQMDLLS